MTHSSCADLLITNANIITMDPECPRAEAVAVSDGRIVAVGSAREVATKVGSDTKVLDLAGRTLMPGFVEAHGHVLLMARLLAPPMNDVRPSVEPTWNGLVERIKTTAAATPSGTPVMFFGFDAITHGRPAPRVDELDQICPDHPLLLINFTGHSASANHAALKLADITRDTEDPPGGKFPRDDKGDPTGEVAEAPAMIKVALPFIAALGVDYGRSLRSQSAVLSRAGLTTVAELLTQEWDNPALLELSHAPDGLFRIRSYEGTTDSLHTDVSPDNGDALFRQTGLKLWVDGAPWLGNIDLKEPYLDTPATRNLGLPPGCCGSANYTKEQLQKILRAYAPSGFQFACHVQGDKGIDTILDVYEETLTDLGLLGTDHRWRLEHCGAMTPEQFRRAKSLGVTCSLFIHHLYFWGDILVNDLFGADRGSHWMRCASAIKAGIDISLHNDGYLTPPDPIGNVYAAVTRRTRTSGQALGTDECISVDQALKAVTINAAWQLFSEHEVGSIETGKFADFVELAADPYTVDPERLREEVTVLGTWLNGKRTDPDAFEAPVG